MDASTSIQLIIALLPSRLHIQRTGSGYSYIKNKKNMASVAKTTNQGLTAPLSPDIGDDDDDDNVV